MENSSTSQYNGSAIDIWMTGGPIYDNAPGYHIIIRNNLVYGNRVLIDNPSDGNGIILDNNDLGGTLDLQNPKTLIAKNGISRPQGQSLGRGAYEFILLKFVHLPNVICR